MKQRHIKQRTDCWSAVCLLVICGLLGNSVFADDNLLDRAGKGIKKGGEAAARGIDKGVKAAQPALKKAGNATLQGLEKGGEWVGKGLKKAGEKLDEAE